MAIINVTLPNGSRRELEAPEGWRVMEVLRDYGLPIRAECGGAAACATCHVRVAPEWVDRLPAPREDEEDRLDDVFDAGPTSRLSCQLIVDEATDGLELELPEPTQHREAA